VPLGHVGDLADGRPVQLEADAVLEALGRLLADASVLKIMHDAKFAQGLLGIAITPADDVQLMAYALEAGAHGFGLEELSALHLGHDAIAHDEVTGAGRARLAYEAVPVERASAHMGELADITWRLWRLLRPRLRTEGALTLYEQVDRPLVAVLLAAERAGIAVDETELRRLSADFAQRMAVMEAEIHRLADASFNLGSPKQLGEVLFERLGLPGGKRMKTGAWGTDAQVLQSLADEGHEIPALVLEWRQLAKLKSTWHGAGTYALCDGGDDDRTVVERGSEFAEYSDTHGRRRPDTPGVYCGLRDAADQCGLFADRAAAAGASGGYSGIAG
jgi:DNA polymerase-1